jgi:hypothetical protein
MTAKIDLRPPTWLRVLSNAKLVDLYCAAIDELGPEEQVNLIQRLDLFHDEVKRREIAGTLTDEDWLENHAARAGED